MDFIALLRNAIKSHQIQFNLPQSNIQTKKKKEKDNVLNCYK